MQKLCLQVFVFLLFPQAINVLGKKIAKSPCCFTCPSLFFCLRKIPLQSSSGKERETVLRSLIDSSLLILTEEDEGEWIRDFFFFF